VGGALAEGDWSVLSARQVLGLVTPEPHRSRARCCPTCGPQASEASPVVSIWYHELVAMTLRLSDQEATALRARAEADGVSMQDAVRRAVREYVARSEHRERVALAAERVASAHADALRRLGE
jgi:hypothetical protein